MPTSDLRPAEAGWGRTSVCSEIRSARTPGHPDWIGHYDAPRQFHLETCERRSVAHTARSYWTIPGAAHATACARQSGFERLHDVVSREHLHDVKMTLLGGDGRLTNVLRFSDQSKPSFASTSMPETLMQMPSLESGGWLEY